MSAAASTKDMTPSACYDLVEHERLDMDDYQDEAWLWLFKNPYSALFIDTGLGKTVTVLTLLAYLIRFEKQRRKILVIAPIKVAMRTWPDEIPKWRHTAHLRYALLRIVKSDPRLKAAPAGPQRTALKNRLLSEMIDDPETIHIINQEAVPWLVDECAKKKTWPYRTVIFDESSRLRDHNSKIFLALKRVRHKIDRLHEMTATPSAQTYMYLFSQIYLLDGGKRLGKDISTYRNNHFFQPKDSEQWLLRKGHDVLIERKIADICLVMRKKDYSSMQAPIIRERKVFLPKQTLVQYKDFRREFVLRAIDDGTLIEAVNIGVLGQKLLQLASGAVYDQDRKAHFFHDEKIEELRQLREEMAGEPLLVSYWFKSSRERLARSFNDIEFMDDEGKAIARWNDGKIPLLALHPMSAGHGLNLQRGGSQLAVFDLFWSLELFLQLIGRLDRKGQTRTVVVHLLAAQDTDDLRVARKLRDLADGQEAMFSRLRALAKELRAGSL